ncbi:MAG: hypothetical protein C0392_09830 [Syntrophus sp. (in: bacteria)]|nr:hypothetical protein [Syntrophus sp. (in: bacteria)]
MQLIFSTYLGGSTPCATCTTTHTFAHNIASDIQGNTYVTGATEVLDLPVLNAAQPQPQANSTLSAFVAKFDPTGVLLWCTYLGGDNQSMGTGIAAMPGNGVAVVGFTSSDSSGLFPTMNPYQAGNNGQTDYFVTVFNSNGNILYSTYLGGSGVEGDNSFTDDNSNGNNVYVDAQGLAYITGVTNMSGNGPVINFPTTINALQPGLAGGTDAFLAIIDPSKSGFSSLIYSSFLGGTGNEKGHAITANAAGTMIAVAGYTNSSDFPTTSNNAYRSTPPPSFKSNGFIAQFTSSLPGNLSSQYTMGYSTYLGGVANTPRDDTYGITLDLNGMIVATGRTQSVDFPMLNSSQPSIYNSAPIPTQTVRNDQPYVVKINPFLIGNASLIYATFLGGGSASGGGGAFCTGVVVDSQGNIYVGGETSSTGVKYTFSSTPVVAPQLLPYTQDALFPAFQGGQFDAILMQVSPDGTMLAYSTFLGGTDSDRTYGLAVDPSNNIVISGLTFSNNFPVKNPAQPWPNNPGNQNAFVTKLGR